jgi:hypothetical protein
MDELSSFPLCDCLIDACENGHVFTVAVILESGYNSKGDIKAQRCIPAIAELLRYYRHKNDEEW